MSANKFADEFKREAVAQVEDRGYPVREVAERLDTEHDHRTMMPQDLYQ